MSSESSNDLSGNEDQSGNDDDVNDNSQSYDEVGDDVSTGSSTRTNGDDDDDDATKSRDLPIVSSLVANGVTSRASQRQPEVISTCDNEQTQGQLQLSAYCNSGLLTLHIVKVQLQAQHCAETVYIKVALQPDETRRTVCKTDVMTSSPNGCIDFNAKFSYELLEEDLDKQVVITAWRRSPNKRPSRFIGLVVLDVRNVRQQQSPSQSTWFPFKEFPSAVENVKGGAMLDMKNMPCVDANNDRQTTHQIQRPSSITNGTDSTPTMQTKLILIYRGRNGFGFSISGENPVVVCRVDDASMAQIAGLNVDDQVLRVDGLNVARSNSEHVAALVRKASHKIVFEIQRQILRAATNGAADHHPASSSNQLKRQRNSSGVVAPSLSGRQPIDTRNSRHHQRDRHIVTASRCGTDVDVWRSHQSSRQSNSAPDRVSKPYPAYQSPAPDSEPPWQDDGKGEATSGIGHPEVKTIDYGWLGPVGDDDDTDGSDKENMATFPRGFRPPSVHRQQGQRIHQLEPQRQTFSSNSASQRKPSSGESQGAAGRWCESLPEFDDNGRYFGMLSAQQGHPVDCRNGSRIPATLQERRLGTIDEVTELSDCSALTLKLRRGCPSDTGSEADFEDRMSKNNENIYVNASADRNLNDRPSLATKTLTERCHEVQVKPTTWSSPDSRNYDEDDLSDRLSSVSTADTSVTVDRQQYCTGVLTFRSGKKRLGLVDLYRQKRQSMRRKIAETEFASGDAAERMSIASGCSSVTSGAPSMKRMRLPSFRKMVRMGIDKLRRF